MAETIEQALEQIADAILASMRELLALQGHNLTGALSSSLRSKIKTTAQEWNIDFLGLTYGKFVNNGVSAARIPFGKNTGAKKSKYIEGLINFASKKFLVSKKEATSIAFAIARKHKREGMPSLGSFLYSKTGKRTEFIQDALKENEQKLTLIINDTFVRIVEKNIAA